MGNPNSVPYTPITSPFGNQYAVTFHDNNVTYILADGMTNFGEAIHFFRNNELVAVIDRPKSVIKVG